ncbi:MAG: tetratricopeptide repeat protein [Acetobacteraceae bacterium]|nr:tetratricopeptide repeat protein [Acetobacteraceae bacterium]
MPDIFDEVNEDLRAERARRLLQRYGFLLVIVVVLIVAGAAGWQYWQARQRSAREAVAGQFLAAMQEQTGSDRAKASATFTEIAKDGPSGYRSLARLREAAIKASAGDLPGALALWDEVSADEQADPSLRKVADLLWVQHQVDTGEPALVEGRIQALAAPGQPWRPLALEARAWLQLRTGNQSAAEKTLLEIRSLPSAPPGVRARANGLLARLGVAPDAAAQDQQG